MLTESTQRKSYSSDLTDEQWAILEPLVPAAHTQRGGRPREVNMREVINTIMYLNRTGCQWDMLPHDLLPKSTAYEYFAVARRRHLVYVCGCVADSSPRGSRPRTDSQRGLHRQSIREDDGSRR